MKKTFATTIFVLLATAGFVAAELSEEYKDYFDGPAGYLITKDEEKAWKQISSDGAAKEFIALFWAKRDPNLETSINEFKVDFDMRVEAADSLFGYKDIPGSMSDRGLVFILLGKPTKADQRAAGASVGGQAGSLPTGGSGESSASAPGYYDEVGATVIWEYDTATLPVKLKQSRILTIFQESKIGLNDFILDRSLRDNAFTLKLIKDIPEALYLHPNLKEVPSIGLLPGSKAASDAQIAWFEGDGPWPEDAIIVATEGLGEGPRHFFWVDLFLPSDVAAGDTVVGMLRETGSEDAAGSFVIPAKTKQTENGNRYELSLPITGGSWTLDLAVVAGGEPIAVTSAEVQTSEFVPEATLISPIYWGIEVEQTSTAAWGDAFNVGGWHLVLPEQKELTTAHGINYMFYVINPALDDNGEPHLDLIMSLYRNGKRELRTPPRPAQLSKVSDTVWMCGSGIALEKFTDDGEFRLKVEVKQKDDETEREGNFEWTMPGSGEPEAEATEG